MKMRASKLADNVRGEGACGAQRLQFVCQLGFAHSQSVPRWQGLLYYPACPLIFSE